jgi:hypothetical protein
MDTLPVWIMSAFNPWPSFSVIVTLFGNRVFVDMTKLKDEAILNLGKL